MIINTGARTDTVQYYSEWLLNRFKEGFVYVRNPMCDGKVTKYELSPKKVDAVIFCSKNYVPILPRLHEITDKYRTYFHYTITAYGKDIEPGVPYIEESIATLEKLSNLVGRERVAWRYDPILLTNKYTVDVHKQTFAYMTDRISPLVGRCIFSFVEPYKKLSVNMPELILPTVEQKNELAEYLGDIARRRKMIIQTCGTLDDYSKFGIQKSGCTTAEILGKANMCEFKELKRKPSGVRDGCNCMESRDIGAYNTCPNGCKYCYANSDHKLAKANYQKHDSLSPILFGEVLPSDEVTIANQKSMLKSSFIQPSLFDL